MQVKRDGHAVILRAVFIVICFTIVADAESIGYNKIVFRQNCKWMKQEGRLMSENDLIKYLGEMTVQQYKTDIGFRTLVESVNDNLYIIPKYQRKYRWSKEQVIGLVESLLRGLPIPPIYTYRNENNQLEILDGQQRVMMREKSMRTMHHCRRKSKER